MKKFAVLGLAVVLVIAFTVPAMAIESVFGGYWRTRAYTQQNFSGNDYSNAEVTAAAAAFQADLIAGGADPADAAALAGVLGNVAKSKNTSLVDTRTRLYYTAIFNESFKFVNKFEMDAAWGARNSYGDIGADEVKVEVKNSYVDFTLGSVNSKIGVQAYKLGRGLFFNDDFAGAVFTYKGEAFELPVFWIKAYEGGIGDEMNDYDVDYLGLAPKFSFGDAGSIQPYFVYAFSDDAENGAGAYSWPYYYGALDYADFDDMEVFYAGFDLDLNFDMISMWLTGIYQFGSLDFDDGTDADVDAWMAAIGAKANFDTFDVHGQAFYFGGQDLEDDEGDIEFFFPLQGQDYHWAEIMGGGIFDNATGYSSNGTAFSGGYNQITNIMAFNIGAGFKATEDLSLKLDLWYAQLAEEVLPGLDEELGTEVDLVATYKLMDGLTLDLVGAYLFAGDSVTLDVEDDENPYELGAQLSLSF